MSKHSKHGHQPHMEATVKFPYGTTLLGLKTDYNKSAWYMDYTVSLSVREREEMMFVFRKNSR